MYHRKEKGTGPKPAKAGSPCETPGCVRKITVGGTLAIRCKECRDALRKTDPQALRREERSNCKNWPSYMLAAESHRKTVGQSLRMKPKKDSDTPYVPTRYKCQICCDQTYVREEGRVIDARGGRMVPAAFRDPSGTWRCVGCKEAYAPEPKPELQETLRSSASYVSEHGELHGHERCYPLNPHDAARNKEYRARRAERRALQVEQTIDRLSEDDHEHS